MEQKKTALITGGSRGIGSGVARALAADGYDVAITYSTEKESGEAVLDELRSGFDCRGFLYQATLQEKGIAEQIVKQAIKDLGHLDLLVNNAGLTRLENLLLITDEILDLLINLNFRAYVMASQTAARHMVKRGIKGNIVFISSTHSVRAYETDGIYGSLKAALNRSVESFALDLAPYGIRVNAVAPGATRVREHKGEMHMKYQNTINKKIPLGRVGTPADIGNAVCFLADNEKASYITGVTVKVDGGLVLPGTPEHPDAPAWTPPRKELNYNDDDL
jgi:NAD(P)-dependent dehydrogenase (short-subunit alcohol dehydrogenase family)